MSAGDSAWGCDPVAGTLASGVTGLCSSGVGVKWSPPLVDEGTVSVPADWEAGLVGSSSAPASTETFLVGGDVGADAIIGRTEVLGVPLVGEAGGLCGVLVQTAVAGVIFVGRKTGKTVDADTRCTLSPAVTMKRAKSVLQTMVPWCLVPNPARAAGEFARTDRAHRARAGLALSTTPAFGRLCAGFGRVCVLGLPRTWGSSFSTELRALQALLPGVEPPTTQAF